MHVLVTGGAGFVGSHVAEFYGRQGNRVVVLDNLSRLELLGKSGLDARYNWSYLERVPGVDLVLGNICDRDVIEDCCRDVDVIVHTAAQTAVTTSITNPEDDFMSNALGTFRVLEAARKHGVGAVVFCSTNKVYGNRVNSVPVLEQETRYSFGEDYSTGISESFGLDLCEHTPYGCSKLTGDLYMQDYAHVHGIRTGVFRMSCIYGERQLGVEDQGWLAWFTIATLGRKPITIFGDGKQVRDVLHVSDLVNLFDRFIRSDLPHVVCNAGGGPGFTLSLLELLNILKEETGLMSPLSFASWRPSDQKVYISDIREAARLLDWAPQVDPRTGVKLLSHWVRDNLSLFQDL